MEYEGVKEGITMTVEDEGGKEERRRGGEQPAEMKNCRRMKSPRNLGRKEGRKDGWKDGRKKIRKEGRKERWKDGRKEG